ncbi:MAG: T9SS type A sorting domain-containing protein [Bacteroidota bacterium]
MYLLLMAIAILFSTNINANTNGSIELISFEVSQNSRAVEIFFVTANEANCESFIIQKATENGQWRMIASFDSEGTDQFGTSYQFFDLDINRGWANYRVVQLDNVGIERPIATKSIEILLRTEFTNEQNRSLEPVCNVKFFEALKKGENVRLEWATGSESNCKYFVLEKENSQGEWQEVETILSTGNPNKGDVYVYMHENASNESELVYRLSVQGYNQQVVELGTAEIGNIGTRPDDAVNSSRNFEPFYAEALNFDVDQTNGVIHFSFSVQLENNCNYFLIEKTTDRTTWEHSSKVNAIGGISLTDYTTMDRSGANEDTYFKLYAVDYNENRKELAAATLDVASVEDIETYPNPTDGMLFIQSGTDLGNISFKIMDLEGNVLIQKENNFSKSLTFDLSELEKGFYILNISDGKETRIEKILVDR